MDAFKGLIQKCNDVVKKYKEIRPFVPKKHRKIIELSVKKFDSEQEELTKLWVKLKNWDVSSLEKHGVDPNKKLAKLGSLSFHTLDQMKKELEKYIETS